MFLYFIFGSYPFLGTIALQPHMQGVNLLGYRASTTTQANAPTRTSQGPASRRSWRPRRGRDKTSGRNASPFAQLTQTSLFFIILFLYSVFLYGVACARQGKLIAFVKSLFVRMWFTARICCGGSSKAGTPLTFRHLGLRRGRAAKWNKFSYLRNCLQRCSLWR